MIYFGDIKRRFLKHQYFKQQILFYSSYFIYLRVNQDKIFCCL